MTRIAIVATTALTLRSFLIPYAQHFRARGWTVHGIAADIESCEACRGAFEQVHNIDWSRNPLDGPSLVRGYRAIRALAEKWQFDVVHVHTPIAAFVTRMALRTFRSTTRVIYTAHGFHFYDGGGAVANAVFKFLERVAGRWTDRLIVINEEDKFAALDANIVAPERLIHMPGIGVDLSSFEQHSVGSSGFPDGNGGQVAGAVFLSVAEFNPGKRHRDIVSALALLGRRDIHVAFAGIGPERENVARLADRLGVREQVHFLGYRRDIPRLLSVAHGFILCSEREGLPRSLMEAMAARVPAIGTDIRGIRDLLRDGAGLLVPVNGIPQIAEAMRVIADDPDTVNGIVAKAHERIADYSLDRVISMHDALYDALLEGRTP